jgi:hypothetical protein
MSGQLHAPAALTPEERAPGTHWIGGWVYPKVSLDDSEKRKFLLHRDSNSDPQVVQPVASYTDCAILAPHLRL